MLQKIFYSVWILFGVVFISVSVIAGVFLSEAIKTTHEINAMLNGIDRDVIMKTLDIAEQQVKNDAMKWRYWTDNLTITDIGNPELHWEVNK